ncbi:LCP family protein [Yinghuangia seranimata]|uniref:LCP family protein n=1 Tax=Yinghuangia seranimata TaxID=408067 RepID=UPI00248C0123|nr:LCP family protein [Yinghuangia seranimata]MDI2128372.1 LCP family protein [Yinghuangia seranimata]
MTLNADLHTFDADGVAQDRPPDTSAGENLLLIGSDTRSGANAELGGGHGDIGRSDTTLLLHVYADHRHAVAVSIPRDALVDVPSCRKPNGTWTAPQDGVVFNSAFEVGGTAAGNPACTQNTVEKLTGLRVDHTMVVDFAGFAAMTAAVGGVEVCLPKPVYQGDLNPNLGARGKALFPQGRQTVAGQRALDYVRLRHGIGDGSDIGRIKRQQAFVASLLKAVKARGLNPTTLLPLAQAATRTLTVDPGLGSVQKLLSFGLGLKNIDLHDVRFVTVPWRYRGDRVAVVHPEADALWAALHDDRTLDNQDAGGTARPGPGTPSAVPSASSAPVPTPTVDGSGIRVTVLNGTTTPGLAGRAAAQLRSSGFTVTAVGTAASRDQEATLVEYAPTNVGPAHTVAAALPGAELRASARVVGIRITVGNRYAESPSAHATTTAPPQPPPTAVPPAVAAQARAADDDVCSNLSYG